METAKFEKTENVGSDLVPTLIGDVGAYPLIFLLVEEGADTQTTAAAASGATAAAVAADCSLAQLVGQHAAA